MKLLLDENLPIKLKYRFIDAEHECYTVHDMGWQSYKNGELISQMITQSFDVLISMDTGIAFQQNFEKYPIPVLIIIARSNSYETIMPSFEKILEILSNLNPGPNPVFITTKK